MNIHKILKIITYSIVSIKTIIFILSLYSINLPDNIGDLIIGFAIGLVINIVLFILEWITILYSEYVAGWAMFLMIIGIISISSFAYVDVSIGIIYILYSISCLQD